MINILTNSPVKRRNDNQLKQTQGKLFDNPPKDEVPKYSKINDSREAQIRKQSQVGGLALLLESRISARIIFTKNINI